ncbi:juvenile hormone esterase-like [Chironomus tepperi]|uniref:juvenile hormone esterase-like n=1 Tax=Chironomus tepperi TaxID=113505 RepID=UPI00391FAE34
MRGLSVKVLQGIVQGCKETLPNGRNYLRFSGIPYAKKPISELRFKSPQKLLKFDKQEIDCTEEGNECFHKSTYSGEFVGSEDCLYLNVYVPESTNSSKLAVMVFLHGGGFSSGSGSMHWYSPEYLLMEDVILVTVNYRLHVLGFLSLPSMGISGNAGLKDQQLALEWVHENISQFNGDPDNICLFGESAGATSVHFQVLNPRSRKLIRSAICQSGTALVDWGIQRNPLQKTKNLAKLLGCSNVENDQQVYKTLMSAPLENLLNHSWRSGERDEQRRNLNFVFKPSIELPSDDAFMSKSPVELIKQEDIQIPIIFGTNNKEGMIQTAYMLKVLESFNKDPVRMVPLSVNIDPNNPLALELGNIIKKFYFGDKDVGKDTLDNHFDLMTDLHFLTAQTMSNELHARYQHNSKQYLYEFRYDGPLNLFKQILRMNKYKGASHVDDLFYLFGQKNFVLDLCEKSPAARMRSTMCKLWTNFAKYQNPTPAFDNPLETVWNPVQFSDPNSKTVDFDYLVIDEESKMERNVNGDRMNFWRNIYKTWNMDFIKPKL